MKGTVVLVACLDGDMVHFSRQRESGARHHDAVGSVVAR